MPAIINGGLTIGSGAPGVDYTLTFNGENSNGVLTWDEDLATFNFSHEIRTGGDLIIGTNQAAGVDYKIVFLGENNSGAIIFMEDEGHFKFADSVLIDTGLKTFYRDTAVGIYSQANTFLDLFADGAVRIGDSSAGAPTNYTNFAVNGIQTIVGTARVKKHLQGIVISGKGANSPTSKITEAPYLSWTFAINDDTHETQIIPKDMDVTASADIIVSWYTTDATADGVDSVNWQAQWDSRAVGELVTAGSTTDTSGDTLCGAQYAIVDTIVETIPANSIAQDDHLGLDITRIALTAGTDPSPTATSIHLISIEIEYTIDKLGAAT